MKKNICLVFISFVIAFLVMEVSLRIYYKDDYGVPTHRNWQFRSVWNEKYANLNSLGHRDHEFSVEKPKNTFRILTIGDSLTWGEGVKNIDDLYTEILENKLNTWSSGINYEVLNLSKKGWNVQDYLRVLKEKGLSYDPDVVVLAFYVNDIEADKKYRPNNFYSSSRLNFYLSRISYAYWYTYSEINKLISGKDWMNYFLSYVDINSNHWKRFEKIWKEIILVCNKNTIKTIVLILPYPNILSDKHPFFSTYRNVEKISKEQKALVLNAFPFINGYDPKDLYVGKNDGHPNEKAHSLYADGLFDFIIKSNVLPE